MQDILSQTVTFILAGGRGARLAPLTRDRSKPAVPFGDSRIIDFALTNCMKSKLAQPFVITQYQAAHLTRHVRRWWFQQSASVADVKAAPVCVPAPKRDYLGTADALFRNTEALDQRTSHVVVLSADHIYDMDYRSLLQFHVDRGADATMAAVVYPSEASRQFGILEVDASDRVVGFEEKPAHPKELPGKPGSVLANMGIYVFRTATFLDALRRDSDDPESVHDLGRNVLPGLVQRETVYAFRFEDPETGKPRYWKDVGTLDSYYEASMEWLQSLPAAHRMAGSDSIVADGVHVHQSAEVSNSILMPGVNVGAGARVRDAILDENVQVLPGAHIGFGPAEDHNFHRTATGVFVVPANSIVAASPQWLTRVNHLSARPLLAEGW